MLLLVGVHVLHVEARLGELLVTNPNTLQVPDNDSRKRKTDIFANFVFLKVFCTSQGPDAVSFKREKGNSDIYEEIIVRNKVKNKPDA